MFVCCLVAAKAVSMVIDVGRISGMYTKEPLVRSVGV